MIDACIVMPSMRASPRRCNSWFPGLLVSSELQSHAPHRALGSKIPARQLTMTGINVAPSPTREAETVLIVDIRDPRRVRL